MTRICISLLSSALLALLLTGCGPKENEKEPEVAASRMARPELTGTSVLNEMFSLDGVNEAIIYTVAIGQAEKE